MLKLCALVLAAGALSWGAALAADSEHEVGGPLAGIKLPLYKTQHGEPAGHPGCIPGLAEKAVREREEAIKAGKEKESYPSGFFPFTTQGLHPEVELYPGAVEHFLLRLTLFEPMSLGSNGPASAIGALSRSV